MTDTQRREAARKFYYKWKEPDKGQEKIDCHPFWIEIFQNILGVEDVTERIEFEKPIGSGTGSTNWIDVYVKETKTLIEQKSRGIALDKPQPSHDGKTPYHITFEPLFDDPGEVDFCGIDWIVVGTMTGSQSRKIHTEPAWTYSLMEQAHALSIPVFMKKDLVPIIGEENMIQEMPDAYIKVLEEQKKWHR